MKSLVDLHPERPANHKGIEDGINYWKFLAYFPLSYKNINTYDKFSKAMKKAVSLIESIECEISILYIAG